jgi:hypothetical protein
MTKKHYIQFAEYIRNRFNEAGTDHELNMRTTVAMEMVIKIATQDNPRFDRNRFMSACGLD